jgi:CheY-like chemotaxis protein
VTATVPIETPARKGEITGYAGERRRVLVVDDDEQFSLFLKEVLEDLPEVSAVALAPSGYAAGNMIPRFKPDAILLDLMMPGVDGFEVCRLVKQDMETRFIRVIAMSGYCSEENRQAIIKAGAETCLAKPFTIDQLQEALGLITEGTAQEPSA